MGILKLDSRQRKPLNSVRFVTHKGSSFKINTTTKVGQKGWRIAPLSTTESPWTPNHLKTTKFIHSNPVVEVKKGEEPPF
jgi:hypothetical protein